LLHIDNLCFKNSLTTIKKGAVSGGCPFSLVLWQFMRITANDFSKAQLPLVVVLSGKSFPAAIVSEGFSFASAHQFAESSCSPLNLSCLYREKLYPCQHP